MTRYDPVVDAIDQWHEEGLVDDHLHERLRARALTSADQRRGRLASRFVTATGGVLLVVAFVVLTTIFWDDLAAGTRAAFLWAVTAVVFGIGRWRLGADGDDRMGSALAAISLPLAMGATALVRAWRGAPDDVVLYGALALTAAMIAFVGARDVRTNPVLPAVALGSGFVFVVVAMAILNVVNPDPLILAMDGAALVCLLWVGAMIAKSGEDLFTARGGRDGLLWVSFAACVPLVPATWFGVMDRTGDGVPILVFALLAAVGVAFALLAERTGLLVLASLLGVADAWYFGLTQGQALGTFLSLFVTALVLFWLGGRLGVRKRWRRSSPGAAGESAPENKGG